MIGPDGFTRLEGYVAEYVNESPAALRTRLTEAQYNALEMARKADLAERRAEEAEAEYHVEQLRDALEGAERRLEAIESLAAEWDSEGRGLVEHCESPRDVHEGQALQRCAYDTREIVGTEVTG